MKTLWQHFKAAPLWGQLLVGALFLFGVFLLVSNIRSCSQERKDRKTDQAIEAVPVTNPQAAAAVDSMKVVLDENAKTIQDLIKQANEAEKNTAAARAVVDSLSKKFAGSVAP